MLFLPGHDLQEEVYDAAMMCAACHAADQAAVHLQRDICICSKASAAGHLQSYISDERRL